MANIINDPSLISLGAQSGSALGSALGGPLQQMAMDKMQEIQQRQYARRLMNLGYNAQDASLLSLYRDKPEVMVKAMEGVGLPPQDQLAPIYRQLNTGLGGKTQQPQTVPQQYGNGQVYPQGYGAGPSVYGNQGGNRPWPGKGGQAQQNQLKQNYSENKQFFDDLRTTSNADRQVVREAKRALEIIRRGRTRSGAAGYLGTVLGNKDTRELGAVYDSLALARSASLRGPISVGKIRAAQATKPQLNMPIAAQVEMLNNMISDAEGGSLALKRISDDLYKANGYRALPGHEQQAMEYYNRYYGDQSGNSEQGFNPPAGGNGPSAGNAPTNQQQTEYDTSNESPLGTAVRGAIRSGVRGVVEPVLGGTGSLASLGLGFGNWATNGAIPTYEDIQNKIPLLKAVPTMGQVGEAIGRATNGYTNPTSELEQNIDSFSTALGSFVVPGATAGRLGKAISNISSAPLAKAANVASKVYLPYSGAMPLSRAIKVAGIGHIGLTGAQLAGAGPVGQAIAQAAFMTGAGLHGNLRNSLDRAVESEKMKALSVFRNFPMGDAGIRLIENLEHNVKTLREGNYAGKDEAIGIVQGAIDSLTNKIYNMTLADVTKEIEAVNSHYGRPTVSLHPQSQSLSWQARKLLSEPGGVQSILRKPLLQVAESGNPHLVEAAQSWVSYNDLFKGLKDVDAARAFVSEHLSKNAPWHGFVSAIFGGLLWKYPAAVSKVVLTDRKAQELIIKGFAEISRKDARAFAATATQLGNLLSS